MRNFTEIPKYKKHKLLQLIIKIKRTTCIASFVYSYISFCTIFSLKLLWEIFVIVKTMANGPKQKKKKKKKKEKNESVCGLVDPTYLGRYVHMYTVERGKRV